ncbi:hypothetical protein B0H14DRAFT_3458570 [Mycena olivaceomarginata]|nr:hypothetical protein B0H14DRAFT_3458570 [Mycena olivaceomarginata]
MVLQPEDSVQGCKDIVDCWTDVFKNLGGVDHIAMKDALFCGFQLAYSHIQTLGGKLTTAAVLEAGSRNWTGKNLDVMHTMTVKYCKDKEVFAQSTLARIQCPIAPVHCSEDIVYLILYADQLLVILGRAKVNRSLHTIQRAPHFGSVTHQNE